MAPEIRPNSRRKNINFPMVFTNQFFYETYMAIAALDYRLTDRFNKFFFFGEWREEVEVKQDSTHIKFPTYSNVFSQKCGYLFFI